MNAPIMLGRPVTGEAILNYDMDAAPVGGPLWVLTIGGVTVRHVLTAADKASGHYVAWCPMPKRDKEEEKRRGIFI